MCGVDEESRHSGAPGAGVIGLPTVADEDGVSSGAADAVEGGGVDRVVWLELSVFDGEHYG